MKKKSNNLIAVLFALQAALLFGLNAPLSKLLLDKLSPMLLASLLYLGAGIGMGLLYLGKKNINNEAPLDKGEKKWAILMILLDILAPFLLLYGLKLTSSANASLLFNFEMVATTIISLVIFKEAIGKRMWLAIFFITISSVLLTIDFQYINTTRFSFGSLLVIFACITWGFENNFTRNMSHKDPFQIVILKGFGSGIGAMIVYVLFEGFTLPILLYPILLALLLGFVSYGLSIFFYIKAQRHLGAARTSAFYAVAPFLGVLFSLFLFNETLSLSFYIALPLMLFGAYLAVFEKHNHLHTHELLTHNHLHSHNGLHHIHSVNNQTHSHTHTHKKTSHSHEHKPDIHHRHIHKV
ncbi:MAG: EamA family transporter [Clostridiales bacterium]|nr:EamA family transporter [Clostridiales bacterium]